MKNSKSRPEYEQLVQRIASGELTRLEAANEAEQITGLKAQTFLSWLRTSGSAEELRPMRGNAGTNSSFAHTDPDKIKAYEDALALALTKRVSVRAAALKYKVSYLYLLKKVHKASPPDPTQVTQRVETLVKGLAADPVKRAALLASVALIPK